jgi:transcriptional regulator with XRE-family HTH domain
MAMDSDALIVNARFALGLSQRAFGARLGVTTRTIQRWEGHGCPHLGMTEGHALAEALRPTRPDLADEVMALARRHRDRLLPAASAERMEGIVAAAATAAGVPPATARAVLEAAFAKAAEDGVDVRSMALALDDTE